MSWFADWFDTEYYHLLYKDRNDAEAQMFINQIIKELEIKSSAKILDLACGKGRHSIYLNSLGFEVIGTDLSAKSIAFAKKFENDTLNFFVSDMREALFTNTFTHIFSIFTSFGYFDNEAENQKVFDAVAQQLQQNGFFILDYFNAYYVENHLIKQETKVINSMQFHIKKYIKDKFVYKEISFEDKGEKHSYTEKVQLLQLEVFQKFAKNSGLILEKFYGDYKLQSFDKQYSERLIMIFSKQ